MEGSWSIRDRAFYVLFFLSMATAGLWLIAGLLPAIASASPGLHGWLHEVGTSDAPLWEIARNAAQTSHTPRSALQVSLDYLFSILNLVLGSFLLRLRPRDLAAQLLGLGMIGTAVAFNLQGHDALQVVPLAFLSEVDAWHVALHIVSGLSYLFALLLFPTGMLVARGEIASILRVPALMLVTLLFTSLSLISVDDHATGLVIVFGVMAPIVGVGAQLGRYRRARSEDERRQSGVLLLALGIALGTAVVLNVITASRGDERPGRVVEYEVAVDQPGTFFFRCDPHPRTMTGLVRVVPGGSGDAVIISAEDGEFDTSEFELVADAQNTIRFTNFDADPHNVAIYRTAAADDPLFIGAEFSGQTSAFFAFRVFRIVFTVIPLALIAGLVRFHLWDVDRVVNRTLLYGAMVAFITIAYLVVVAAAGAVFGAGARLNLVLSIALTVVIAAIFQPLREGARSLANRLVYGKRATPYEVLAEFSERVGNTIAMDQALPQIVEIVGTGTGADRADVWLRVGRRLEAAASWPDPAPPRSIDMTTDLLPELPDADLAVPVEHGGEVLGAIAIAKGVGEPLGDVEQRLLADVAAQAGLVLRNARLTAELRASRQRIVAAQDDERRRIERDIHDGAQQHLISLAAKLGLAQQLADRSPEETRALLHELQGDASLAMNELRDLARGIFPPLLADKGLVPALDAHARRCPIEVRIHGEGVDRIAPEIENAVYFCCLEAIQNAVKHGRGPVEVTLDSDGDLHFTVSDRGPGFDPSEVRPGSGLQNMSDRVAALGGEVQIASRPGTGTTVTGRVPIA